MKKILIVDDEKEIRQHLVKMAKEINDNIEVLSAGTANETLEIAKDKDIKVFFIDIKLKEEDGIKLALELRKIQKYKFTMIIFVTSYAIRRLEAFQDVHCYDFIIKKFSDNERLKNTMEKMLLDYLEDNQEDKTINLEFNHKKFKIKVKDILFIEYRKRRIIIQSKSEEIKYKYISLKNFKKLLPSNFIQISQYLLINQNHIKSIENTTMILRISGYDKPLRYTRKYKNIVEGLIYES